MPGFRPGRAPRQLVEKRFRKQVSDQVKSTLLMASLEQIDEDYKLNPITQPKLDVEAIKLPDDGPMSFEMDVEVRPDFQVARVQGAEGQAAGQDDPRAGRRAQFKRFLERYAQIVPKLEGAAEIGDYLTADLTFLKPDGERAQRGQGDPVPAPARAAVPGRPHSRHRRGARGSQAGRDPRGRGQARLRRRPIPPCAGRRST